MKSIDHYRMADSLEYGQYSTRGLAFIERTN